MQLSGQILTGSTQTIATKKGDHLQKTRLKVLDLGPEAAGGDVYWIDFLGEAALAEDELRQVNRQPVTVEVRRMYASSGKNGGSFLNANGGAILLDGQIVQRGLRTTAAAARSLGVDRTARTDRAAGDVSPANGGASPFGFFTGERQTHGRDGERSADGG